MKKILGLLAVLLLLAVPVAAQEDEPICSTVPEELTYHDWGGGVPGPHEIRAYLYPGNEAEGRSGWTDHEPYGIGGDPTGALWLLGELDFVYCNKDDPQNPMARVRFNRVAQRSCQVSPIGCGFEDCDLICKGLYPKPIGPFDYYVSWAAQFESYVDIVPMWNSDDIAFHALALDLNPTYPRAYLYIGFFDKDEDGNCEFSGSKTLWVYKIDQLGDMEIYNPRFRRTGGRVK